jgi:DNA-binding YbaB/EbfC family protein
MAKRKGGSPAGGGGMGNMFGKIQKMQHDMEQARAELEKETVEVSVGGGAVTIVMTGHQRVESITLNKELIDTSEDDWATDLQDLLVMAVNQATEESQAMVAERMEEVYGDLGNIPGLGGLLGG